MRRGALRLFVSTYCWLTAAYAVLSASPFTYQEFVRPRMFGTGLFNQWHVVLYWIWLPLAVLSLREEFGRRDARRWLAWGFGLVWTGVGAAVSARPLLPSLIDDRRSLIVGLLALAPLLWLSVVDHCAGAAFLQAQRTSRADADRRGLDGRWLVASMASALFAVLVYAVAVPIAMHDQFEPDLLTTGLTLGLLWNAVDHVLIFSAAFLALAVLIRVCSRARFAVQYAVTGAVFAAALSIVSMKAVCDTLQFDGPWRIVVAAACGLTITATWGGTRLRRWADAGRTLTSPLDVFFGPPPAVQPGARALVPLVVLAALAYGLAAVSGTLDWDFLLLQIGVFVLWVATLDQIVRVTPPIPVGDAMLAVVCGLPLAASLLDPVVQARLPGWLGDPLYDVRHVLDRYVVYSPSFRLADRLLRHAGGDEPAFDRFVRANSGLSKMDVRPVDLNFVDPLGPAPVQPAPNIFLFVIDSLRPDYLSPYNPAVTFTPRLAEFAADSLVFRNTFTMYGGTGLSLPSIWAGSVGVHKQYVTPFAPMNTLEKLLRANGYRRAMSVDVLMQQLLLPPAPDVELDRGIRTMDYDVCRTLEELESRFPATGAGQPPVFGYSLPQNLHVSNILSASVPAGEAYPGFHAPYASRVRRVDRCFGAFVDFLKRRHQYERSVIIVTSDHGEMLGEEGRWGHAYYLFPQVLRTPLIVHLPPSTRVAPPPDLDAISLLTDIAPTVYGALGYQPRPANRLMGASLVGDAPVDFERRRRDSFVVAASYSAVYAVVRGNGRHVYIVDAINSTDYAYDRDAAGAWTAVGVTAGMRDNGQRIIREHIDEIRHVYHMPPSN